MPPFTPTDDEATLVEVELDDGKETAQRSSKGEKSEEETTSLKMEKTPLRDITAALAPKKVPGAKIEVIDPRNHGEDGSVRYTTYCVLVPNESGVRRRYSDFQWLYQHLLLEKPGAIIPIIPHNRTLTLRLSNEQIQKRSAQLQQFLRRVLDNPELNDAEALSVFIKAGDNVFLGAKTDKSINYNGGSNHGETVHNVNTADVVKTKPRSPVSFPKFRKFLSKVSLACATEMATTKDEAVFDNIQQYVSELDNATQSLISQADAFIKSTKDRAKATGDMSKSCRALFESSYPDQIHVGDLSILLNVSSKGMAGISHAIIQEAIEEMITLEEPLQDLQRDVEAVKVALHCRKEAQMTLTRRKNAMNRLVEERKNLVDERENEFMANENYNKGLHLKEKSDEVVATSEAFNEAEAILEDVSKRLVREMNRFGVALNKKMRKTMMDFARVQVQYNNKINDGWMNLLRLDDGPTDVATEEQLNWSIHEDEALGEPRDKVAADSN